MTNDLKHLFICFVACPEVSLLVCLLDFSVGLYVFLFFSSEGYLYILSSLFSWWYFSMRKVFNFDGVSCTSFFSFMVYVFCILRNFCLSQSHRFFPFFFFRSFMVLALTLSSIIRFELISVYDIRSRFIFPPIATESCQHYLLKGLLLSPLNYPATPALGGKPSLVVGWGGRKWSFSPV